MLQALRSEVAGFNDAARRAGMTPKPTAPAVETRIASVAELDVILCSCGAIAQPRLAQETLRRLGLPCSSPSLAPARGASQNELDLPPDHSGVAPPFSTDYP